MLDTSMRRYDNKRRPFESLFEGFHLVVENKERDITVKLSYFLRFLQYSKVPKFFFIVGVGSRHPMMLSDFRLGKETRGKRAFSEDKMLNHGTHDQAEPKYSDWYRGHERQCYHYTVDFQS